MKYLIFLIALVLVGCNGHFFQSWTTAPDLCAEMCNTSGQEYTSPIQYSAGVCICDNKAGREAALGYHLYLNGKCDTSEKEKYQ